jgi:glycosyltransferase involved in cell wall biosynthesis
VPLHLRAADMFLLTSRWENLPISIVEAFRAGLPVVATDCGGVKELVDDSVGALLPVGDAAGIAGALAGVIADPDLRAAKGAAALARSKEDRFDPAAVHARFADMYREVIARHRG